MAVIARDAVASDHLVYAWPFPIGPDCEVSCSDDEQVVMCPAWMVGDRLGPGRHLWRTPDPSRPVSAYFVLLAPVEVSFDMTTLFIIPNTGQGVRLRAVGSLQVRCSDPGLLIAQFVGLPFDGVNDGILRSVSRSVERMLARLLTRRVVMAGTPLVVTDPSMLSQIVEELVAYNPTAGAVFGVEMIRMGHLTIVADDGMTPVLAIPHSNGYASPMGHQQLHTPPPQPVVEPPPPREQPATVPPPISATPVATTLPPVVPPPAHEQLRDTVRGHAVAKEVAPPPARRAKPTEPPPPPVPPKRTISQPPVTPNPALAAVSGEIGAPRTKTLEQVPPAPSGRSEKPAVTVPSMVAPMPPSAPVRPVTTPPPLAPRSGATLPPPITQLPKLIPLSQSSPLPPKTPAGQAPAPSAHPSTIQAQHVEDATQPGLDPVKTPIPGSLPQLKSRAAKAAEPAPVESRGSIQGIGMSAIGGGSVAGEIPTKVAPGGRVLVPGPNGLMQSATVRQLLSGYYELEVGSSGETMWVPIGGVVPES